jgi:hypothetical protein
MIGSDLHIRKVALEDVTAVLHEKYVQIALVADLTSILCVVPFVS